LCTKQKCVFILINFLFYFFPSISFSQECETSSDTHNNTNTNKSYKIKLDSLFDDVSGFSTTELIQSVVLGADIWNWQGNTGSFRYTGTTSITIPLLADMDTQAKCNTLGINYSIVYLTTEEDSNSAHNDAICGGNQFLIKLYLYDENLSIRNFGNGATSNVRDISGTVAHEFGHSLGLGHCNDDVDESNVYCIMRTSTTPNANWRALYEWEYQCTVDNSSFRDNYAYRREHTSSGFGSPTQISNTNNIVKATSGITYDPTAKYTSIYHETSTYAWDEYGGSNTDITNPSTYNGSGLVNTIWRESTGTDRMIYSYWDDDGSDYTLDSVHIVRQIRSTNEFSSQTNENLSRCTSMTGWMTCSSTTDVDSYGPISFGFLDDIDRTVSVWMNHDRTDYSNFDDFNEIYISVGHVNDSTLSIPHQTDIRTSVPPSVSCLEDFSGSYDCIMTYVNISDMTNTIKSRRFYVSTGTNNYNITLDSTEYTVNSNAKTASPMALWYISTNSKFYLAFRSSETNQNINIYESNTSGTSWTLITSNLDYSITGPSAVGVFRGSNNQLVYTQE